MPAFPSLLSSNIRLESRRWNAHNLNCERLPSIPSFACACGAPLDLLACAAHATFPRSFRRESTQRRNDCARQFGRRGRIRSPAALQPGTHAPLSCARPTRHREIMERNRARPKARLDSPRLHRLVRHWFFHHGNYQRAIPLLCRSPRSSAASRRDLRTHRRALLVRHSQAVENSDTRRLRALRFTSRSPSGEFRAKRDARRQCSLFRADR